jgi:hypothetical protein
MRYLVTARVLPGRERDLLAAIRNRRLGAGSVAGREYLRNMREARLLPDGRIQWVEVCYCDTPLEEERAYWEEYFHLERVLDAHNRENCRDLNGTEEWACGDCDCTEKLETALSKKGKPFLLALEELLEKGPQSEVEGRP